MEKIGRYEIKAELGRGGMATVFHAHDSRFGRDVAVKVLPREFLHDPTFRARFEREARTIATLEHPAIVPVYDFGEEGGQPYLVMRFMPGGSLADRLENDPFPVAGAASLVERLASALDASHGAGIIHRDLKPGNILFDQYDNAYLSDFGIVKMAEATAALTGSGIIGTPAYMSPEQVHGDKELDGRSDVYALGVILFQMLTGNLPYEADTPMRLVMKHVMEPVPRILEMNPSLPPGLDAVITRAMAKEPINRYPTAGQMSAALAAAAKVDAPSVVPAITDTAVVPPEPELPETVLEPTPPLAPRPRSRDIGRSMRLEQRRKPSPWLIGAGLLPVLGGGLLVIAAVFLLATGTIHLPIGSPLERTSSAASPTAVGVEEPVTTSPEAASTLTPTPAAEIISFTVTPTEVFYQTVGVVEFRWETESVADVALYDDVTGLPVPLTTEDQAAKRYAIPISSLRLGSYTYTLTITGEDDNSRSHKVEVNVLALLCSVISLEVPVYTLPNPISGVGPALVSERMTATGRTIDSLWTKVIYNNMSIEGWIPTYELTCSPDILEQLVIVDIEAILPPTPIPTRTPTPIRGDDVEP